MMHVMHTGLQNTLARGLTKRVCSAHSLVSLNLASPLRQRYPHTRALVVSTENITQNWYFGNERSMLIPNCLFRVGGAACLLSNRLRDSWRAK